MTGPRRTDPARQAMLRHLARAAPRPPARLLPALLELASAVGSSGPSLLPPAAGRILVIVPHPDDEAIGAGGLISLLAGRGAEVAALLVTDGEATIGSGRAPSVTGRRRRGEFERSLDVLGAHAHGALGLPDGDVANHRDQLITQIHAVVDAFGPALVLTPWPLERHPDHRAVAEATAEAMLLADWSSGGAAAPQLWTYEVHTPITTPTHVIDITAQVGAKRAALEQHVTAAGAFDLMACFGLARWRSLATRAGRGAAEAFLALEPSAVLELASSSLAAEETGGPVGVVA